MSYSPGAEMASHTAEAVFERRAKFFTLVNNIPVPTAGWLKCGICGGKPLHRYWRWHIRHHATIPHRVDISFKCVECAQVWGHGVALTPEEFARRPYPNRDRKQLNWREIQPHLANSR